MQLRRCFLQNLKRVKCVDLQNGFHVTDNHAFRAKVIYFFFLLTDNLAYLFQKGDQHGLKS